MRYFIELSCFMGFPQNQGSAQKAGIPVKAIEIIVHKVHADVETFALIEERHGEPFQSIIIFKNGTDIKVMETRKEIEALVRKAYSQGVNEWAVFVYSSQETGDETQ